MKNFLLSIVLGLVIAGPIPAQVSRPTRTAYTPQKLQGYTANCALWRTDATFHSTVRLKNSLDTSPINATVTLYMADGTPYVLPPVYLKKGGVEEVDVNAALAELPPAIRRHLSSFGSASVQYNYEWQGVVLASMSILDTARSLEYMPVFVFPATPASADNDATPPPQSYDGLWWRYADSSTGFIALNNTTDKPTSVAVSVSGLSAPAGRSLVLAPHATSMLDLRDFFAGDPGRVGGLHVAYSGTWGAVQVVGGLEDATKGFSAEMPIAWHLPSTDIEGPQQVAAAGVMVNEQDPLLNFPQDVSFTPYAYFRNVSSSPKALHFTVYHMEGRTVKDLPLPDLTLQPGEARELPIANLMRKQTHIQDINVVYSYDGRWGDILAGMGSTDQTGSYVFPVVPELAYKGGPRASHYWLAQGGFDTMYTLWNPESYAQELLVTLKYGDGQTYRLPVTLESHASAMIDIGELIRTQQLDQDGEVLPMDVKHGSLVVSSPSNQLEDAINVVVGIGIYNPTKATCGGGCVYCYGFVRPYMNPSSATFGVGGTQQFSFGYIDNNNNQNDLTNASNWNSNGSQIVTVQTYGQGTPGLATGTGPGSAGITASGRYPVTIYSNNQQVCYVPCPQTNPSGGANTTVVGISFNGQDVTGKTTTVVVGQQIALTATLSPSQVSSQSWSISGAYVGGYTVAPDSSNASVPSADTTRGSVTYYYTAAGSSAVTYRATLTGGGNVSVTTTFTVRSPTYSISTNVGTVNVNQDDGWQLQYGRSLPAQGPRGVAFTATITQPPGFSGNSQWVQLVNSFSGTYTPNGGTCTSFGLDAPYPYRTGNAMSDSPAVALVSPFTREQVSMSFISYLMWQPPQPSIPVSIAQVTWSWAGAAALSGSTWAISGTPSATSPVVLAQTALPTWTQIVNPSNNCH